MPLPQVLFLNYLIGKFISGAREKFKEVYGDGSKYEGEKLNGLRDG
jgi:hypothetical protein